MLFVLPNSVFTYFFSFLTILHLTVVIFGQLLTFIMISSFTGPVNVRHNPAPETPGNSIGLEAIIRKALMGNYDQSEERSPSNAATPLSSGLSAEGRVEDSLSQGANT